MAITLAVGTSVAIASTYGSTITVSAITNAASMVATFSASHGVVANDYVEFTSGWDRLNARVLKTVSVSTNDATYAVDTTSTSRYPAGTGTGTAREITAWTTIGQITKDIQVGGGEQQYADITTLADVIQKQIPTRRSPVTVSLPLFYDNSLGFVTTVRSVAETATATAVRFTYPNGTVLVANAYWSYQDVPTIQDDTLRGQIDLTFAALPQVI
jgi:hypothetical protein